MSCPLGLDSRLQGVQYKYKYLDWMQHCGLYTKGFQCNQSSYNSMYACIHAEKLNASLRFRQIVANNGCSIKLCMKSVSSSFNYGS